MSQNLPVGSPPLAAPSTDAPIGVQPGGDIIHVSATPVEPAPAPLPVEFKRRRGQQRVENITVEQIELFLARLAETGKWYEASELAALGYQTIRRLRKDEPEFAIMCEEAMEQYKDTLQGEAHRRAVTGWDEPVFSQRTGTQMGVVRKYDSRLLELMLKRHIPEFREKFEGEIKLSGGVLIAPVAAVSLEDWAKQNREAKYDLADGGSQNILPGT